MLYIFRGLPGSGKTTLARQMQRDNGGVLVGRDHFRLALFGRYKCTQTEETYITEVQAAAIMNGLMRGENVYVDDLNLRNKYVTHLVSLAEEANAEWDICNLTMMNLHACLEQNLEREEDKIVPGGVIMDLHNRFLRGRESGLKYTPPVVNEHSSRPYVPTNVSNLAIGVDLDGTLAITGDRDIYDGSKAHLDTTDFAVLETVVAMLEYGYDVFFCSGRSDEHRHVTLEWLHKHLNGRFTSEEISDRLFMRPAGDQRRDSVVKLELFDEFIRDRWNVVFMLDDRNQVVDAWRSIGLKVFQVAPGNF